MFVFMFSSSLIGAKISPKFTSKEFQSRNLSYFFNVNFGEVLAPICDKENLNLNRNTTPQPVCILGLLKSTSHM